MLLVIWLTFSAVWIFYRVVFAKQFLLWDWQDGPAHFFWNTPDWNTTRED